MKLPMEEECNGYRIATREIAYYRGPGPMTARPLLACLWGCALHFSAPLHSRFLLQLPLPRFAGHIPHLNLHLHKVSPCDLYSSFELENAMC